MVTILGVVLVLISIGTILGPVAGAVAIYRDDLSQLVITPEIRDIMNGNSTILPASHFSLMAFQTAMAPPIWMG